jgi:hypothetical protein
MEKSLKAGFEAALAGLVKAISAFSVLLGLLVVIPLTLWFAWAHQRTFVNPILVTLFCLAFGWGLISAVLCFRTLKNLGLDGEAGLRLFSGSRPADPGELRAWQFGWHFMYSVLAVMFCLIAIPLASWFSGK